MALLLFWVFWVILVELAIVTLVLIITGKSLVSEENKVTYLRLCTPTPYHQGNHDNKAKPTLRS